MFLSVKNKNKKGFTLIELLVVISIIGLLSSIVLARLNVARENANIAKTQTEIRTLYQALISYNLDNDSWPVTCNNINTTSGWNASWSDIYFSEIGEDPWGTAYFFDGCPDVECSKGQSSLCSAGPNKSFQSWNRPDMTTQGDDVCIYFEPQC